MIEANTFYYTVSTIPQVLAAVTAVVGAFLFFRLEKLQRLLVGDGKAVLERKDSKIYTETLRPHYLSRLIDAVYRENIPEIKEVLKHLSDEEASQGISKTDRPIGFQYAYEDRFCTAESTFNKTKLWGIITIAVNLITIIGSVVALRITDIIIEMSLFDIIFNSLIVMFLISVFSAMALVIVANYQKTIYENLKKRDKVVNDNKMINKDLP